MDELIVIVDNTPLADSRAVAQNLGIYHGDFFGNIILKYQEEVEEDFGVIRFQNGKPIKGSSGGRPERYALLTETQVNTYMSYSRNTEQARACKRKLVKAFDEAKKIIEELLRERLYQTDDINEVHRRMRDYNMWLARAMFFTTTEKTTFLAFSGILKGLGFAANAFLDTSLGAAFYPWCKSQGYDMSLVKKTKRNYLVGYRLKEDGTTYDWDQPNYYPVWSYPEDPFGLAWSRFLVEYYWPDRFLPYITYKYKGEERAKNIDSGMKVISFFTGLTYKQIAERSNRKGK